MCDNTQELEEDHGDVIAFNVEGGETVEITSDLLTQMELLHEEVSEETDELIAAGQVRLADYNKPMTI